MSRSHFSGPVASVAGFEGNITGNVTGYSAKSGALTGAGAFSTTTTYDALVTTGANALTLAAPTIPGIIKVIQMITDGGDGTLASTNIVGQSSGSTSITFNDAGDMLVLAAAGTKWIVLKEVGVTAA